MNNSIAKIEAKVKIKEAKSARLVELQQLELNNFIEDLDLKEIEKEIQNLKNELNLKTLKTLDQLDSLLA